MNLKIYQNMILLNILIKYLKRTCDHFFTTEESLANKQNNLQKASEMKLYEVQHS